MIHDFSQELGVDDGETRSGFIDHRSDIEKDYPTTQWHNNKTPDIDLAIHLGRETVYITGAQVDVYLRTDSGDVDDVWGEDADPTYWSPITLKAVFEPQALQVAMELWSTDAKVILKPIFQYDDAVNRLGRMLRPGDVLYIPFNSVGNITPKYFKVLNATPFGSYRYRWVYIEVTCHNITGDITIKPHTIK